MKSEKEIQKLKVYTIKKIREIKKLVEENSNKKDWLTVNEVEQEFNLSRKTFDRLRVKGLIVSQPKQNGKILVERNVMINFLNK